jgi:quercetin dioxygenase-like cupin family protein
VTQVTQVTRGLPDSLRSRLFGSVDHVERFSHLIDRTAEILDVPFHVARRTLHLTADIASWDEGWLPDTRLKDLPILGPKRAGGAAIFVRLGGGVMVPYHRHPGLELTLVLEGDLVDGGKLHHPGELVVGEEGTKHSLEAGDQRGCLCLILNMRPIELVPPGT